SSIPGPIYPPANLVINANMRNLFSGIVLLIAMAIIPKGMERAASGWKNNCHGSTLNPRLPDCHYGLLAIDPLATYEDRQEFSPGHCMIQYRTDGTGPHPISGAIIRDTAQAIMEKCDKHKGSFGTGNCEKCHVTPDVLKSFRMPWDLQPGTPTHTINKRTCTLTYEKAVCDGRKLYDTILDAYEGKRYANNSIRQFSKDDLNNGWTIAAIMNDVFDKSRTGKPTPWPGLTFGIDKDEALALLATPNGLTTAYLLIDRAKELGKRVPSVTIFAPYPDWRDAGYAMFWDLRPVQNYPGIKSSDGLGRPWYHIGNGPNINSYYTIGHTLTELSFEAKVWIPRPNIIKISHSILVSIPLSQAHPSLLYTIYAQAPSSPLEPHSPTAPSPISPHPPEPQSQRQLTPPSKPPTHTSFPVSTAITFPSTPG
ncbi:MAG: hypothetical protein Q9184_002346, partial [Pyrenodesmia sp. 2 TL-2023]